MSSKQRKFLSVLFAMAFGILLGIVYFITHPAPMPWIAVRVAGIIIGVTILLKNTVYNITGGSAADPGEVPPVDVDHDYSYVSERAEDRLVNAITARGKVSGLEKIRYLEGWHWRRLFTDLPLPVLAVLVCAWGIFDFVGVPQTEAELMRDNYAWLIVGGIALMITLIWIAEHGRAVRKAMSRKGAFKRFGKVFLWVLVWWFYQFPGLGIFESLAEDPGTTGFWVRWTIVCMLWTLYMAKTWLWGSFCVTNKRVMMATVLPFGMSAKIEQLASNRVSKYDLYHTFVGKQVGYGGLRADTDSNLDQNFQLIFPLAHYQEANQALVEANWD